MLEPMTTPRAKLAGNCYRIPARSELITDIGFPFPLLFWSAAAESVFKTAHLKGESEANIIFYSLRAMRKLHTCCEKIL